MHGSRNKIPSEISRPYIYDVKFLVLLGTPYIHDISMLRVKPYTYPLPAPRTDVTNIMRELKKNVFLRKRHERYAISIVAAARVQLDSLCFQLAVGLYRVFTLYALSIPFRSPSVLRSSSLLLRLRLFFEQALSTPYFSASIIRPQNVENGVRFRSDRNFRFSARD
jgi:hypothetical protein